MRAIVARLLLWLDAPTVVTVDPHGWRTITARRVPMPLGGFTSNLAPSFRVSSNVGGVSAWPEVNSILMTREIENNPEELEDLRRARERRDR